MRTFACDDGTVIRAGTDAEFVGMVERHLRAAHPELAGRLSRSEVLALASQEPSHLEQTMRRRARRSPTAGSR